MALLQTAIFGMNVAVACVMMILFVASVYFAATADDKGFLMYSGVYLGPSEPPTDPRIFGPRTLYALLAAFTAVTFTFHVLYASLGSKYTEMVRGGNNWLRWLEYSISATIMLSAIALASGVAELHLQVLAPLVVVGVMALGDVVEKLLVVQASGKANVRTPVLVATGTGWLLMLAAYGVILANFDAVAHGENAPPLPVYVAVVLLFILFMCFGAVQLADVYWMLWKPQKRGPEAGEKKELAYTALSVTSKVLLVSLMLGGISGRAAGGEAS
jgi:hypothetical protein